MSNINTNFSNLGKELQKVLIAFTQNQNLCKLIVNTSATPIAQGDVTDPNSLINTHIYPFTYKPPTQDACVLICVYFQEIRRAEKNGYARHLNLVITVICHRDLWIIEDGLRVYEIMHEIDLMLNRKSVMGMTSDDLFALAKYSPVDEYFNAMTLVYSSWDF